MCFWKGEKEDVLGPRQLFGANKCFSDRPEAFACFRKKQPYDKARRLAEACQGMCALQEKVHEQSAKPVLLCCTSRKRGDHRICRISRTVNLEVRREDLAPNLQIADEEVK